MANMHRRHSQITLITLATFWICYVSYSIFSHVFGHSITLSKQRPISSYSWWPLHLIQACLRRDITLKASAETEQRPPLRDTFIIWPRMQYAHKAHVDNGHSVPAIVLIRSVLFNGSVIKYHAVEEHHYTERRADAAFDATFLESWQTFLGTA